MAMTTMKKRVPRRWGSGRRTLGPTLGHGSLDELIHWWRSRAIADSRRAEARIQEDEGPMTCLQSVWAIARWPSLLKVV